LEVPVLRIGLAAVLLSALGVAQTWTGYGQPCGGAQLWVSGSPRLGHTITFNYVGPNSYSYRPAVYATWNMPILMLGTSDRVFGRLQLPLPLPMSTCQLLCAPDVILRPAFGGATFPSSVNVPIPMIASWIGMEVFHQWLLWNHSAGATGNYDSLGSSNAGKAVIGL
jgi:hypothetical protein